MFPLFATATRPPATTAKASGGAALLERAPMLRDSAERVLASVVKGLQTMAGATTTVEGTMAGIAVKPLRDLIAGLPQGAVAATITCAGLPCTILATLDPVLVDGVVELLAGGNGAEARSTLPRAATSIDGQYAHIVVTLAASAIETEWAANGFGATRPARLEGTTPPDVCGAKVEKVGTIDLALGLFGQRGTLTLALPPVGLAAFVKTETVAADPALAPDPNWSKQFQRELGLAPVRIEAYLETQALPLGMIAQLQLGQILALPATARSRATLICDGRTLYRGELGQDEERYSVRIDELVAGTSVTPGAEPRARSRPPLDIAKAC